MRTCNVAIVGATGLVGREIVEVLDQRQFPIGELRLFASQHSAGELIECGGRSVRVDPFDASALHGSEIVFVATPNSMGLDWVDQVTASGAIVIDTTQGFASDLDVPLIVPEVNPSDLGSYAARGIVASPDPTSIALAIVLHPLREMAGIRRLVVTSCEPVSGVGRGGIEELQQQTLDLMQGRSPEGAGSAFPQRIAFNLFPQVGSLAEGEASSGENVTIASVRRLIDQPDLPMSLTRVRVPLFFGQGLAIHVESDDALMTSAVVEILRAAPGVLLAETTDDEPYPTPASIIGEDAVALGRVRSDPETCAIDLWAAIDNVRKGAAVNAVQIAELLLRDHL